jgi:hypothetical protein
MIVGRRHLEQVLRVYIEHYNVHRPHRALLTWTPSLLTGQVAGVCSMSGLGRQVVATSTGVR